MAHHVADTPQSTSGTPAKIKTKDSSVGPHKRASTLSGKKKIPPTETTKGTAETAKAADITGKAVPDVTAKAAHDVTGKAAHDVTGKAAHDVTAKAAHDVAAKSAHDVAAKSAPDVTGKTAPGVTPKAATDVPANIRDNVPKPNESTSKNVADVLNGSGFLNAASNKSKDSEDFLKTIGSDSDPFLSDRYNSKSLLSQPEPDPLLLPGADVSLKDKEKQERRRRKKEKKEKRALGLIDEFPKEQSDLLNMMVTLNQEDLNTKLKDAGNNLVVIDFFAKWCGPCKMISPKIEELAKEYPDVVFLKVDVDECEDIASEFEISSMPTFVFIKSGAKLETFSGANFDKLKETLLKHK